MDRARDPSNEAFFTADTLENVSEALVREGIQNSIDAALERGEQREVKVEICLETSPSTSAKNYLESLRAKGSQHFEAGLPDELKQGLRDENLSYLTFEDFGTKGLTGDVKDFGLGRSGDNAFFAFFRAEGRSPKKEGNLGRWGIGKHVFSAASNLKTYLGFSIRDEEPRQVLMGTASLQSHSVGDTDYLQDAWFGVSSGVGETEAPLPVEAHEEIESFRKAFGLSRSNETGLSIVVPFVSSRVEYNDLVSSTIRNFFWPILQGALTVLISCGEEKVTLNADTILGNRSGLKKEEREEIEFAQWASDLKPKDYITLPTCLDSAPKWLEQRERAFGEETVKAIKEELDKNERVGIRIPVVVRPKYDGLNRRHEATFAVYLERCRHQSNRPKFIREGILIKNVRSGSIRAARALVSIDDKNLAGLLGDSEGPNHTEWQKDSQKFRGRYIYGPDTILFVSRSVLEILKAIDESDKEGDKKLLLDLFYLPKDGGFEEKKSKPKKAPKSDSPEPPPPSIPTRKKRYEVKKSERGFAIVPGPAPFKELPAKIKVEAGYAIRRKDPIKQWAEDDFVFTKAPLRYSVKPKGLKIREESENVVVIEIQENDFEFGITGFDRHRDLTIKTRVIKSKDEKDV
ncbi:hypothetical protein QEH56_23840 [Pelagicoccus enzymogenes]|uniref:hypothetical protein n=1 Tax=Pelagicoccus enzymogenes TaxID=2773457 RepID=UPI00280F5F8A|nr:hypothetical protein [Pelagicoccus enzymogenes]MDQ8201218.1 hypothetical protein [Pelagicoccus enzymogenes]